MTLAGTPTATELSGIFFVTMEPAPIITLLPILVLYKMMLLAPIKTSFPISIVPSFSLNLVV